MVFWSRLLSHLCCAQASYWLFSGLQFSLPKAEHDFQEHWYDSLVYRSVIVAAWAALLMLHYLYLSALVNQECGQYGMLIELVWLMLLKGCLLKWLAAWIRWNSFCFCFVLKMSCLDFIYWNNMSDSCFCVTFLRYASAIYKFKFEFSAPNTLKQV